MEKSVLLGAFVALALVGPAMKSARAAAVSKFQQGSKAPVPTIIVPATVAKMTAAEQSELRRKTDCLRNRNCGAARVSSLVEFIRPEELSQISVDSYMADGAAWVTREKWTPESIKAEIAFVLTARPENGSIGAGGWSEINNWSVVATMMFKSGKRGRIFLDGLHVSYEDPEGRYWLYRVTGSRPWK